MIPKTWILEMLKQLRFSEDLNRDIRRDWCYLLELWDIEGKHWNAEWENRGELLSSCSKCGGKAIGTTHFDEVRTAYCPHCGTKMRNGEERR